MSAEYKRCPDCGETKPVSEWGKRTRSSDGLTEYCKACVVIRNRERRANRTDEQRVQDASYNREYQQANRDALRERQREYVNANRNRINEYQRKRRVWLAANPNYAAERQAKNRQKRLAYNSEYRRTNPKHRHYVHKYRRDNPEVFRRSRAKARALVADTGHIPYSDQQLLQKIEYWGWKCWICRQVLSRQAYELDHVKPINKGGADCLSNIRPACRPCNKSKGRRWPYRPPTTNGATNECITDECRGGL